MIAYFTGVLPGERSGHYCVTPERVRPYHSLRSPWGESDSYPLGDAAPTQAAWPEAYDRYKTRVYPNVEPEGLARVVRRDGWTLVCLWDRSGDGRHGSHASFALHADLEPAAALEQARALFPGVFARIERHLGRAVVLDEGRTA